MKKNKIIVFGAAGFIGTYLINELLKKKYQIIASDISDIGKKYYKDKNIPFIHVDITKKDNFEKLEQVQYDAVIHLAAHQPANVSKSKYDPKDYINVNVNGTLNILEFCRKNNVGKIIYTSSHRNTQGLWVKNKPIREDDGRCLKYTGQYAMYSISESAAQDCILHYQAQYGLKGIIFRLPPVYGYGPHTSIFLDGKPIKTGFQIFIENAVACKPLEVWGDSTKGRDIIYVKDVVSAYIKALNNEKVQGLYNIASGKFLTLKEEAETIAEVFWGDETKPKIIERPDKSNNIESYVYDISKAKRQLDWRPEFDFKKMLKDIKKEMKNEKFNYLLEKRKMMLNQK